LLLQANYQFVIFDGLNRWYVRQEDSELAHRLSIPVNAFDNYVTISEHQLREELRRYRTLNPFRRLLTWISDIGGAISRKIRSRRNLSSTS